MRTTLTLDEDIAERLAELQQQTGLSFKEVANRTLRIGLEQQAHPPAPDQPRFTVHARPLGIQAGLNYDNIGELLEQVEGAGHK